MKKKVGIPKVLDQLDAEFPNAWVGENQFQTLDHTTLSEEDSSGSRKNEGGAAKCEKKTEDSLGDLEFHFGS